MDEAVIENPEQEMTEEEEQEAVPVFHRAIRRATAAMEIKRTVSLTKKMYRRQKTIAVVVKPEN